MTDASSTAPDAVQATTPDRRTLIGWVAVGLGLVLAPGIVLGSQSVADDFAEPGSGTLILGVVGLLLLGAGFVLMPAPRPRRVRALVFLAGAIVLIALWVLSANAFGWRAGGLILLPLATAAGIVGWLVLRGRRWFPAVIFSLLAVLAVLMPLLSLVWAVTSIIPALVVWLSWAMSITAKRSEARRAALNNKRAGDAIEVQAQAMRNWQAAYALANPGQAIPAPPAGLGMAAGTTTNTAAILAFVFGILGGAGAIVFGHIALQQIKRTGQAGFGFAVTGLVLGYGWLAVVVVSLIAYGALIAFR